MPNTLYKNIIGVGDLVGLIYNLIIIKNIFTMVGETMRSDWCVYNRWTQNMKSDERRWEQGDGRR
jgi:hypothetical protein